MYQPLRRSLLIQKRKTLRNMSLKSSIEYGYIDKNGLVSPHLIAPSSQGYTASGNGLCYTGEYYCLLEQNNELVDADRQAFEKKVRSQCTTQGCLQRSQGDTTAEGPDDYYGVAAGCQATGNFLLADDIISYGWKHFGSYSLNGKWSATSFLWRQPQLLCALYSAARRLPLVLWPLRLYTALVIAFACRNAKVGDQDAWRLTWLLVQATSPVSFMCRLASKVWLRRLHKRYGTPGMPQAVAGYFETHHPFYQAYAD